MYVLRTDLYPSLFIVLMGTIDAITTVIGILYFGAAELNPFMTGIVNSNIAVFLVLKVAATFLIAGTYVLSKRTLNKTQNKQSRSYKISNNLIKVAFAGLTLFLVATVINNLIVLLA